MTKKQQTNAADEIELKTAKDKDKLRAQRERDDLEFLLASLPGRRFIWRKLGECGVFRTSFTGNSTTFFNEGMRNVGLKLLDEITEVSPQALALMMQEAKDDSL